MEMLMRGGRYSLLNFGFGRNSDSAVSRSRIDVNDYAPFNPLFTSVFTRNVLLHCVKRSERLPNEKKKITTVLFRCEYSFQNCFLI